MPVIEKYTSKAQFVQACMDKGWVAPGDVIAMSAAYDFLKNPKGVDTKTADAFLEKVVENPIWMLEDRAAMLDEMKKVFAPLSANPTLSGLNLSGRIMAHPGNGKLSQDDLDEMMGRQLTAALGRDGKPDYQQAEDALMAEQLQFGNQINTQQTQAKEDDGFNLLDQEDNEFFLFGDDQNQTGSQNQGSNQNQVNNQNQGSNQNRINEEPIVNQSGGVLINDDVPAENPNKINESSGENKVIYVDQLIADPAPEKKTDLSVKTNEWEYLNLRFTFVPKAIRNASDPAAVGNYLAEHADELSDQEKQYLTHKQQSLTKIREKTEEVQNSLKQGKYAPVQMNPLIMEEEGTGTYMLTELKQPSFQTAKNGCWSCFYQMALQSKGVEGLTQEDIRAYRPPLQKGQEFGNGADDEMNTDSVSNAMDMGDLTLELLPNTMMKSVEIDSYRRFKGRNAKNGKEKDDYFQNIVKYVKGEIIDSIKINKTPVGLMMDGHYITITGIDADTVYYKNSMPTAEAKGDPDYTFHERLDNLLDSALNGFNAESITLTRLEDIKLSKEGDILYNMPGVNVSVQQGGTVVDGMKQDQAAFQDERHTLGKVIGRSGEYDLEEKDETFRKSMKGVGFYRVEKVYLPHKLNKALLEKDAQDRPNEEETRLKDALTSRKKKQQELENAIKQMIANGEDFGLDDNEPEQVIDESGFKVPVTYLRKPFFGGNSYADMKGLLQGSGWEIPEFERTIRALSNLYDLHPFDGNEQKNAADALFTNHFAPMDREVPGTVSELKQSLTEFLNVIEHGGQVTDKQTQQSYMFKGASSLGPLDFKDAHKASINYLKGMVGVLTEIEAVAPGLSAKAVNLDSFMDEKGNVKKEKIQANQVIQEAAAAHKADLTQLFNRNVFQSLKKPQVGLNRELLFEADPYFLNLPVRGYTEAGPGAKKLNRLSYPNSEMMYTGFIGMLEEKGFPFARTQQEQNMLNAVFNILSSGGDMYNKYLDQIIGKKGKITAHDMNELLIGFNDILTTSHDLPADLLESAKCIGDTLGAMEQDKFRDLEIALNNLNAVEFAKEYRKWMKEEQESKALRGYPVHYDPRIGDALKLVTKELDDVNQGFKWVKFCQQVKAELQRLDALLDPKPQEQQAPKEEEKKEGPQQNAEEPKAKANQNEIKEEKIPNEEFQQNAEEKDSYSLLGDDEDADLKVEQPKEEKKEEPQKNGEPQKKEEENEFLLFGNDEGADHNNEQLKEEEEKLQQNKQAKKEDENKIAEEPQQKEENKEEVLKEDEKKEELPKEEIVEEKKEEVQNEENVKENKEDLKIEEGNKDIQVENENKQEDPQKNEEEKVNEEDNLQKNDDEKVEEKDEFVKETNLNNLQKKLNFGMSEKDEISTSSKHLQNVAVKRKQEEKDIVPEINDDLITKLRTFRQRVVNARGWSNSDQYNSFQRALDTLISTADRIAKNDNINFDKEKATQEYLKQVDELKERARAYKEYRWQDKTSNPNGERGKKKLNDKDRGKLMLMDEVLLGKHSMFAPKSLNARPDNERNAYLIINEDTADYAKIKYDDYALLAMRQQGSQKHQLGAFRDSIEALRNTAQDIMDKRFSISNEDANDQYSEAVRNAYRCAVNYKKSVLGLKNYKTTKYDGLNLTRAQLEALAEVDKFLSGKDPLSAAEQRWKKIRSNYRKNDLNMNNNIML